MRRQITKQLKQSWGFSLVEMAVVIAIMGILMTFGIKLATSYQNKGAFSATVDRQKEIKDTLTAYLGQHGRLPCPAAYPVPENVINGEEVQLGAFCTNKRGLVPFATLGLPQSAVLDGWDRFFTYSVWDNENSELCTAAPTFTPEIIPIAPIHNWADIDPFPPFPSDTYTHTFHDGNDGCIKIEEANSAGVIEQRRRAVAVLVSHGPNGFGGYNSKARQVPGVTDEETINIINHETTSPELFHSRPIDINGFDDIVMGITANDLLIPLKKSGAIISIKELERQYLYTLFNVEFDGVACKLNVKHPATTIPPNVENITPTSSIKVEYKTATVTITASQYCRSLTTLEPELEPEAP